MSGVPFTYPIWGGGSSSPFITSESWITWDYNSGVPQVRYYTIDLDAGTYNLEASFADPSGLNKGIVTDGTFLLIGKNTNTNALQYTYNGSAFVQVLDAAHGGLNPWRYGWLPPGGGDYIFGTGMGTSGRHFSSWDYDKAPTYAFNNYLETVDSSREWQGIMDFRSGAYKGTNSIGNIAVTPSSSGGGPYLVSWTVSGGTPTKQDDVAQVYTVQRANCGWNRDTGKISIIQSGAGDRISSFQLNVDTYQLTSLGYDETYTDATQVQSITIAGAFVVTIETSGPTYGTTTHMKTYIESGGTLTEIDDVQVSAFQDSISCQLQTSPYTDHVYYQSALTGAGNGSGVYAVDGSTGAISLVVDLDGVITSTGFIGDSMVWWPTTLATTP
jgi:hypothetical protein